MNTTPIRTILVDDHPVVVAGARALIEASGDIVCVGEANTGAAAMELVRDLKPDVIILDVSLPDTNGLLLARRILEEGRQAHIVMMTLHEERSYIQQALQIGAKGFVLKRSAGENLLQAIRSVMLGGLYLDPGTAKSMVGTNGGQAGSLASGAVAPTLTGREMDVLRMVALGYSNKEIAAQLKISVKSIETYKARAADKLDLHTRAQIVRFAATQGWLNVV